MPVAFVPDRPEEGSARGAPLSRRLHVLGNQLGGPRMKREVPDLAALAVHPKVRHATAALNVPDRVEMLYSVRWLSKEGVIVKRQAL